MEVVGTVAPSYRKLRPMKPETTRGFPVYPDLSDLLVASSTFPDDKVAHVLATCSGYAYGDEKTLAILMARLGLEDNHCLRITESVDVMLVRSTAFLVQSRDGKVVILCFRGTEPLDFINWLVDLDVNPGNVPICVPGSSHFDVHGGFYRNVRAIRFEIIEALERALRRESVLPDGDPPPNALEALYITGHSLGGAMASLMTLMLLADEAYEPFRPPVLRATYTYGQPMVGSPEFARACDAHDFLKHRVIRYVYNRDMIPQLPPSFSGPFGHFGHECRHTGPEVGGTWTHSVMATPQLGAVFAFVVAPLSIFTRQIRRTRNLKFKASLQDHFPRHYVASLGPDYGCTEFGDDYAATRAPRSARAPF